MIQLKTPTQIAIMQKGGKILTDALKKVIASVKIGVTLAQLDKQAEEEIKKAGATPSFRLVKGYKWSICSCVNEVVVHGIPDEYVISEGDIVGLDCGVYYQGFHTDAAWTVEANGRQFNHQTDEFLTAGKKALFRAVCQMKPDNYIYDISLAIQDTIQKAGYSVVKTLVGHGIGRRLHEEPEVPCFIKEERQKTEKIVPGMVLAIEVIYNQGNSQVVYRGDDDWTIITKDGKISGLFEATVAATRHGCLILTSLD